MNRQCRACEGTGVEECPGMLACHRLAFIRGEACTDHTCHPCRGTGRVSERIGPEDALADSATFVSSHDVSTRVAPHDAGGMFCPYSPSCPMYPGIYGADVYGHVAGGRVAMAVHSAREAARAAFRAVPALRGEA